MPYPLPSPLRDSNQMFRLSGKLILYRIVSSSFHYPVNRITHQVQRTVLGMGWWAMKMGLKIACNLIFMEEF